MASSILLLSLSLFLAAAAPHLTSAAFTCTTTGATCNSIIDYVTPNATTLSFLQTRFNVSNLQSILAVNSAQFPLNTTASHPVAANSTVRIPFPCRCSNDTGLSDHVPVYTVVQNDGLSHIATDVFGGLMTYQEIAAANNVTNVNLIIIGQKLWIPLPCSCDDVGGSKVVHYGHVVGKGATLEEIATEYGASQETLIQLNGLADPKALKAGQVLDVPLKACTSAVNSTSLDYPIIGVNGTNVLTANGCVTCKCNNPASNSMLQCESSGLKSTKWSTCPAMQCGSSLSLGNTTTSSGCTKTCSYAGYTADTILTTLAEDATCSAPSPSPSGSGSNSLHRSWVLGFVAVFAHLIVILNSAFFKELAL